ncbi:phosphatase PAP2 family protein [Nocardia pseudobrasiliensis]|uniref:Undecaprenyl-diphosphatase n=1 Tax=Nocardia pseudobrasiliensis TaxID=45979 RepID=A0A370IEX0_9NOCA|nr:phosphatase PAP2 family protein [Nocardia pseudobrasiliensis]RDI68671.1 undecaprenyl-diphosphatase [Nocardia pseudobrasiliensis]
MVLLVVGLLTAVVAVVLVRRGVLHRYAACALIAATTLLAVVVELTAAVISGDGTTRLDTTTTNWVVTHRQGWLNPLAMAISDLGSTATMTAVTVVCCALYAWQRRWSPMLFVGITAAGAGLLVSVVKRTVGRERPPIDDRLVIVAHQSFPSGHTLGSTAVVGALTTLAVLSLGRRASRIAVTAAAAIFVAAVGLSRVYLGVHWLTDVLAGWSLGLVWLILGVSAYLALLRPPVASPGRHSTTWP